MRLCLLPIRSMSAVLGPMSRYQVDRFPGRCLHAALTWFASCIAVNPLLYLATNIMRSQLSSGWM
jgi:hypothetical protein